MYICPDGKGAVMMDYARQNAVSACTVGAHLGANVFVIAAAAPLICMHFVYLLVCIVQFVNLQVLRHELCRPQVKPENLQTTRQEKPATMSEDYDLTIIETMEANSPESSTNELDSPPSLEMRSLDSEYLPEEKVHCNNHPDSKMTVALQHQSRKLWKQFDTVGTEMIVTRRGRYAV